MIKNFFKSAYPINFLKGSLESFPIALSYLTCAIPFGILAAQMGIPKYLVVLMSLMVYACSSQCLALSLMASLAHPFTIFIATLLINFRHFFMGMSLGNALGKSKTKTLALIGLGNTDETYALNMSKYQIQNKLPISNILGTNITAHIIYVLATAIGAFIGESFSGNLKYLTGALPVMFLALVTIQLKDKKDSLLALLAITLTFFFSLFLPNKWPFLTTILVAPTIATLIYFTLKNTNASASLVDK